MLPEDRLELDAAEMRRLGYRVIDVVVDRIAGLDHEPAWRGASRAFLESRLREPPPAEGGDFEHALQRLIDDVLPFAARVDHPRFMAFVPGSPTWPAILADVLATGYNLFQGTWLGSAGPSQVELIVLDWFKEWLDLPPGAAGLFLSGGSAATLTAIACARLVRRGTHTGDEVIYFSSETHSSVEKATRFLGFSSDRVRIIPVDEKFRLPLEALRRAVEQDEASGLVPFLVVANAGATSTGAIDPLPEIADFCRRLGIWLHVDAAYGGFAILTGRGRDLLHGLSLADSVTLDPHKWLYQPFEAGCLLVRDGRHLEQAFHALPHYLQDASTLLAPSSTAAEQPGLDAVNFGDRGYQLTRSARALKVWLSVQVFGVSAFRDAIDHCLDLTEHAEARLRASPAFELLTPAMLGVVCFRRSPPRTASEAEVQAMNERIVRSLAESGVGMISSTRLHGRYALRLCILNHRTARADVDRVLDWLEAAPLDGC
jgi:aromatic-L-amino-acid decarboxylase